MKWYTAVGVKMESTSGTFLVRVGKATKNLLGVECYVWNTLLWSFVEETKIYGRMAGLLQLTFPGQPEKTDIDQEEFSLCLRRLLARGLVVCQENETMEGAGEMFLKGAHVACVGRTWGDRFLLFCESIADGNTFRESVRVFQKRTLEKAYEQLLRDIRGSGKEGFVLEGAERERLQAVLELYISKLLFIQSIKEGFVV
jgi:hypothetical protein